MPIGEDYLRLLKGFQRKLLEPEHLPPRAFLWGLLVVTKLSEHFGAEYQVVKERQAAAEPDRLQQIHVYGREVRWIATEACEADQVSRGAVISEESAETGVPAFFVATWVLSLRRIPF